MPWGPPLSKPSSQPGAGKRAHVRKLADGTTKTYYYDRKPAAPAERYAAGTVGALVLAYKRSPEWEGLRQSTRTTYSIYLRDVELLAVARADGVKRHVLLEMRDAVAKNRGPGAATGFMRAASALWGWAIDRGLLEHNPIRGTKGLPGGHLPAWTADEAERAIAHLPEPYRRVVVLALYTGQRRGDLVALRWSAYDGRTIRLKQGKTGVVLAIPVHPALRAELDAWRKDAASTQILTRADGRPWSALEISQKLPRVLRAIGLPAGLNVHGLRKLAAARLADAGCSVHEIAAITGYKSLSMVQLYTASADQERLAEAAILRLGKQSGKAAKRREKS